MRRIKRFRNQRHFDSPVIAQPNCVRAESIARLKLEYIASGDTMKRTALTAAVFGFLGAWLFQTVQIQLFGQAYASAEKVVSATRFDLVDSSGKLRAQLGMAKEGSPGFWIMDDKGIARIAMGLYPDGTSHIGLQDRNGAMIQLMRSFGSSEAPLLIFKNKGQDKMILGMNNNIEPFFISFDKTQTKKIHSGFADGP